MSKSNKQSEPNPHKPITIGLKKTADPPIGKSRNVALNRDRDKQKDAVTVKRTDATEPTSEAAVSVAKETQPESSETRSKGRRAIPKKGLDKKDNIQNAAIKFVKEVNGIPYVKDISAKDWQTIFRNNGLEVSIHQVNNSFKRKGEHKRPLTAPMYLTLKHALKDPERNLILRRTVERVESVASHHESLGIDTPSDVALPGQEVPVQEVPKAREVQVALEKVEKWVDAKGSKREMDFFKEFASRIQSEVEKEKKQKMIRDFMDKTASGSGIGSQSAPSGSGTGSQSAESG